MALTIENRDLGFLSYFQRIFRSLHCCSDKQKHWWNVNYMCISISRPVKTIQLLLNKVLNCPQQRYMFSYSCLCYDTILKLLPYKSCMRICLHTLFWKSRWKRSKLKMYLNQNCQVLSYITPNYNVIFYYKNVQRICCKRNVKPFAHVSVFFLYKRWINQDTTEVCALHHTHIHTHIHKL